MSDTDCGHGWVYRAPGGVKARCGGPGLCSACNADLARLAALKQQHPDVVEAELQRTFDRAREAT
jgi:hypothetical protein